VEERGLWKELKVPLIEQRKRGSFKLRGVKRIQDPRKEKGASERKEKSGALSRSGLLKEEGFIYKKKRGDSGGLAYKKDRREKRPTTNDNALNKKKGGRVLKWGKKS